MSTQDKIERILKQIHVSLSEGQTVSGNPDKVLVDKKEVLSILEQLNLAIYEMMDQYEVTSQSRELAQRRSEKKGQELIERVSRQTEDVYAASLIYTDDALNKVQQLMAEALSSSRKIWDQLSLEVEKEERRIKANQMELREQLQDFKDSNKYLSMIEECNREREKQEKEKENKTSDKKIQNEEKHYAMKVKPEIKVNPAYFERRGIQPEEPDEELEKSFVMPEIKVDLDAEYFKWQAGEEPEADENSPKAKIRAAEKKEWKSLFGRK